MTAGLFDVLAFVTLVTLVLPLSTATHDDREWLFKILNALKERDGSSRNFASKPRSYWDMTFDTADRDSTLENALSQLFPPQLEEKTDQKRFSALLCCNHPPTRPPITKRVGLGRSLPTGDPIREFLLSELMQTLVKENEQEDGRLLSSSPYGYWSDLRSQFEKNEAEAEPGLWDSRSPSGKDALAMKRTGVTPWKRDLLGSVVVPTSYTVGDSIRIG